jgi:hypothetical protein
MKKTLQNLVLLFNIVKLFFLFFNVNSSVEFVKRQINEVIHANHALAMAASSLASVQILVDISDCIEHILINDML